MRIILKNFHIVDENLDIEGSVTADDGIITVVKQGKSGCVKRIFPIEDDSAALVINGRNMITEKGELPLLMPAFVDLHAHFRESVLPEKEPPLPSELLESASLAAAAGGYGTVVCMANTKPVTDTIEKAAAVKRRSDVLGLIDLYPVLALSKNMEGKELSEITNLQNEGGVRGGGLYVPLMLSEDGKDLADDALFLAAMNEARRIEVPVSCHCDLDGENNAVNRAIELGKKAGCHIHIAHVSTKEAVEIIRRAKAENSRQGGTFRLTCEVMPHNISLTEEDAQKLGKESFGRVNPPLRTEEDRLALINALKDGTIDAIATDHAPHSKADKEKGSPGFSGLETAFAVCHSTLVRSGELGLSFLSLLMSANPAGIIGLGGPKGRGRIHTGSRADFVIIDPNASWIADPAEFKTRGKNSPFAGRMLYGKILMTLHEGRVVFENHSKK
ncbi:MAG: dihydroorotase [Treponema sp.]|jgi:dihydroorotase|nr:dihydroorotase [Treponema sp.]